MVAQAVGQRHQAGEGGTVAVILGGGGETDYINAAGDAQPAAQRAETLRGNRDRGRQAPLRRAKAVAGGRERGHGSRPGARDLVAARPQVGEGGMVAQVVGQGGQAGEGGTVAVEPGGGNETRGIDIAGHPYPGAQRAGALRGNQHGVRQAQLRRADARAGGRERGHGHRPGARKLVGAQPQVGGGGMVAQVIVGAAGAGDAGQRGAVAVIFGGRSEAYRVDVARHPQPAAQRAPAFQGEGHALGQAPLRRLHAGSCGRKRGHGHRPGARYLVDAHFKVRGGGVVAQVVIGGPAGAADAGQRGAVAVQPYGVHVPRAGHAHHVGRTVGNSQHVAAIGRRAGQVQAAAPIDPRAYRRGKRDRVAGPADTQIGGGIKGAGHYQVGGDPHPFPGGAQADAPVDRKVAGNAVRAQAGQGVHGPPGVGSGVRRARAGGGGPGGAVPEIERVQGRVHPQVALVGRGRRRAAADVLAAGMQGGIYGVRGRGDLFPGGQALVIHLQLQPQAAALPGRERRLERGLEHAGGNLHLVFRAGPELGAGSGERGAVDAENQVPAAVGQEPALAHIALVGEFKRHLGGGGRPRGKGGEAQGGRKAAQQESPVPEPPHACVLPPQLFHIHVPKTIHSPL